MNKEPPRRYASARALADDLRRFERGEPIAARPLGPLGRLARWARRRPTAAALSVALVITALMALALVGGGLWLNGQRLATVRAAEQDLRDADQLLQQADLAGAGRAGTRQGPAGSRRLAWLASASSRQCAARERREKQAVENKQLMARLDAIRLDRSVVAGDFDRARSDRDYETEFRAAGLGTVGDAPAGRGGERRVLPREPVLVAALDDWAICTSDSRRRTWLLEVARTADPDPWRDKVRDPLVWNDRAKLRELAETAAVEKQSVQLLIALGERLQSGPGNAEADAVNFLRRVEQAHVSDFWANYMLADALADTDRNEEAVGYYRAALAVRPDVGDAWYNSGLELEEMDRWDDALAALEQCVRLDPRHGSARYAPSPPPSAARAGPMRQSATFNWRLPFDRPRAVDHTELALALRDKRQWDEAIVHFRAAVNLEPDDAETHYDLGMAIAAPANWMNRSMSSAKPWPSTRIGSKCG